VTALREQFVAYCEAWLRYAMFDHSSLREVMIDSIHEVYAYTVHEYVDIF